MPKGPQKSPRFDNRKAGFHYEILDTVEAGISLTGSEVKSLRDGKATLDAAFAVIEGGQMFIRDLDIAPYPMAGYAQHKPKRERKLLVHRREIRKFLGKVTLKGLTLIPLSLYFNERGWVKVVIALARGKKTHDKREDIKKRDIDRDVARTFRRR